MAKSTRCGGRPRQGRAGRCCRSEVRPAAGRRSASQPGVQGRALAVSLPGVQLSIACGDRRWGQDLDQMACLGRHPDIEQLMILRGRRYRSGAAGANTSTGRRCRRPVDQLQGAGQHYHWVCDGRHRAADDRAPASVPVRRCRGKHVDWAPLPAPSRPAAGRWPALPPGVRPPTSSSL